MSSVIATAASHGVMSPSLKRQSAPVVAAVPCNPIQGVHSIISRTSLSMPLEYANTITPYLVCRSFVLLVNDKGRYQFTTTNLSCTWVYFHFNHLRRTFFIVTNEIREINQTSPLVNIKRKLKLLTTGTSS